MAPWEAEQTQRNEASCQASGLVFIPRNAHRVGADSGEARSPPAKGLTHAHPNGPPVTQSKGLAHRCHHLEAEP